MKNIFGSILILFFLINNSWSKSASEFINSLSTEASNILSSKLSDDEKIILNSNYIWMSHNQVLHFIKKGIFNIEARLLFACFNIKNIL